jgi:hypothetical protein
VSLSQEKARLDAKNRANVVPGVGGKDTDVVNQAFSNKQIILKQLQDKLTDQQTEVSLVFIFSVLSLQSMLYTLYSLKRYIMHILSLVLGFICL